MSRNKSLIFIIALALVLRVAMLFKYGALWSDEMFSVTYSQQPWAQSWHLWLLETNPPLHMILLKLWFGLFPVTELFARLPSLIFGLANIAVIYLIGQNLFNRRAGLLAALFLTLNSYHVFMSDTARGYSLLLLLASMSIYYFLRLYLLSNPKRNKHDRWIFLLTNTLLLYTHLTSVLIFSSQAVLLLFSQRNKLWTWVKTNLIPLALWSIWAIPASIFKITSTDFGQAWFFQLPAQRQSIFSSLRALFTGPGPTVVVISVLVVFCGALMLTLYQQKSREPTHNRLAWLLPFLIIPLLMAGGLSLWNIKFFIITLPALALAIGYLLSICPRPRLTTGVLALLMLPGLMNMWSFLPVNDWRAINDFVIARSDAATRQILIYTQFSDWHHLNKYFNGAVPTLPYYPENNTQNWHEATVTKNYLRYLHPVAETTVWVQQHKLNQYQGIFLLNNDDHGIPLKTVLEQEGWKAHDIIKPRLMEYKELIYYTREAK